jgi:hypothetical protein
VPDDSHIIGRKARGLEKMPKFQVTCDVLDHAQPSFESARQHSGIHVTEYGSNDTADESVHLWRLVRLHLTPLRTG